MACRGLHPAGPDGAIATSPKGGRRAPSLGLRLGLGLGLLVALALVSVATLAADRDRQPAPSSTVPTGAQPKEGAPKSEAPALQEAAPGSTVDVVASATVESPATVGSSWSAAPVAPPPGPVPPAESAAVRLARQAAERYGVQIVVEGQDWGPDEPSQALNIGAVISAMDRLPVRVTSSVVQHPHGPLSFVSNREGRTLDGWQPYGGFPITYYTNSDQGPAGSRPANEVVLITGSSDLSIGHEVLHAYQFRDVGPDQYVLALLGDEMRSFMAATGWRQVGSEEQLREAVNSSWDAINALFVYEGRALTYVSAAGTTVMLAPPNPLEAFAVTGSIYYTRPEGMPLPDWPEHWAWFSANLG